MPTPFRRRSPAYVRSMTQRELHALTGGLVKRYREGTITRMQDWLLDGCFSELEHRRRNWSYLARCSCEFCCSPFPVELDDEPRELPGQERAF